MRGKAVRDADRKEGREKEREVGRKRR